MTRSLTAAFMRMPLRAAFEHWFGSILFRYPVLASESEPLPGLRLCDLVVELAAMAYQAGAASQETRPAVAPLVPEPDVPVLPVETRAKRAWSTARRERAQARWASMSKEERAQRVAAMRAGRTRRSTDAVLAAAEALS